MSLFRKKKPISEIVKIWLNKSQDPRKTYVLAVIHKKDKRVYNSIVELENDIISIDKTPYYAGKDAIFYRTEIINKKKYEIPMIDIYEGYCIAIHPSLNIEQDIKFSKRVVDTISLKIEQGILENKRKQKLDMKKILLGLLIGGAVIFIIIKMF